MKNNIKIILNNATCKFISVVFDTVATSIGTLVGEHITNKIENKCFKKIKNKKIGF